MFLGCQRSGIRMVTRPLKNFTISKRRPNKLFQHQPGQYIKNQCIGRKVEELIIDTEAVQGLAIDDQY